MKKVSLIIIGLILGVLISFGVVYGKEASQGIEVFYRNIKLFVDGGEVVPKDANGNLVEPFIYNGTTYLPVRAVAEALDKDVKWDGKTASVYIGKTGENEPDNYLDKVQYSDYSEGTSENSMKRITGNIKDVDGKEYTNGFEFYVDNAYYGDKNDGNISVYFPLNGQYSKLKGNIVVPSTSKYKDGAEFDVWFYGDGDLLYKATGVTYSMPFDINIDVEGINELKIVLIAEEYYTTIALTNLALYE